MRRFKSATLPLSLITALSLGMGLPTILFSMEGASQVAGKITKIEGERFTVHGDLGQEVTLRVTKDTNVICAGGKGESDVHGTGSC